MSYANIIPKQVTILVITTENINTCKMFLIFPNFLAHQILNSKIKMIPF